MKQSPDHGGANAVEDKLSPEPQGPQQKIGPVRSEFEYFLSGGVLVFAAIIIALEVWVIVRENKGWGTNATRIVIVTIIIMAALFLITAGYSQRQIGPVMGLLGTIAGYVLGKSETARVPS